MAKQKQYEIDTDIQENLLCGPAGQNTNQVRRELGSSLSLMTKFSC